MIYEYVCDACEHTFEEYQSIHADTLLRCPECDKHQLRRIISGGIYASVKRGSDEITVGHLADRNRSEFSDDQKEMIAEKRGLNKGKAPKKKSAIEFGNPKVNTTKLTDSQKERYIMTGEAPASANK